MAPEIIDLTGSPPPPSKSSSPSSRALRLSASASARRIQFKKVAAVPFWANPNRQQRFANPQIPQWVPRNPAGQTYQPSPMVNRFETFNMLGDQPAAAVYEPAVTEPSTFLFPLGTKLKNPNWTPQEHELFVMGLIKHGKGCWSKISKNFLLNKTPQEVQSYATSFFRQQPTPYSYSFKQRFPNSAAGFTADDLTRSGNLMAMAPPAASYAMPPMMAPNQQLPHPSHTLFPVEAPFFPVSPGTGEISNTATATSSSFGFQMKTGGASTSMTASGGVDLVLRLG